MLAVGNLNVLDGLASSSRGPATDGRIKPDICAVGTNVNSTIDAHTYDEKSGTSMACPAVAGNIAVLYEAYRDMHNGADPSGALINAAVLNTADDLGNPGPDFKYGWGRINARRAYNLLESEAYQFGEVAQGELASHIIEVPENVRQMRVMVYWTDYQGVPSSSRALVNDINMTIVSPSNGTAVFPWVLNSTPNPIFLDMPAQPGIDDLNNVEQIVFDNPEVGNFEVKIEGFDIPQGPQRYVVVYEIIEQDLAITFPIGGESITPGFAEQIRWDALDNDDDVKSEFSLDGGLNWEEIVSNLPGDFRTHTWFVP